MSSLDDDTIDQIFDILSGKFDLIFFFVSYRDGHDGIDRLHTSYTGYYTSTVAFASVLSRARPQSNQTKIQLL